MILSLSGVLLSIHLQQKENQPYLRQAGKPVDGSSRSKGDFPPLGFFSASNIIICQDWRAYPRDACS